MTAAPNPLAAAARRIAMQAIEAVDVRRSVQAEISLQQDELVLCGRRVPLAEIDRVLILAVGKAALPMYAAAAHVLLEQPFNAPPPHRSSGLRVEAVVIAPAAHPSSHSDPLGHHVRYMRGGHPLPDEDSLHAAQAALQLLASADERTAVLFLISGGASAMMEQPLDPAISLQDMVAFHRALVGSGLPIAHMNALRKHLSAVKGGRLAAATMRARMQCTLLISDVPAAQPDAIGSGPSLPDSTTLHDCRRLLTPVRSASPLPASIDRFFAGGQCVETPKANHPAFTRAHWKVILSSEHLARAAAQAAVAAGFAPVIDNTCDEWEYRDAARYLLDRSQALAAEDSATCLISVGEVSVQLNQSPGDGGRNQQFALWCAGELARREQPGAVLSVGSDGVDGNSASAGAVCDESTTARAARMGLSFQDALERFDAAPLLRQVGDDITTGPTGNNLRDLRLVLTGPH